LHTSPAVFETWWNQYVANIPSSVTSALRKSGIRW
jgi:hypothetical protein